MARSKTLTVATWTAQIMVGVILLQTLYFKFSGAEESVYIFSKLGMEPWGRYASGVVELIAGILLLAPRTPALGAALAMGVISGAIASHLTKLGIVVKDDGGQLFALACIVFVGSAAVVWIRRGELPVVGPMLARASTRAGAPRRLLR